MTVDELPAMFDLITAKVIVASPLAADEMAETFRFQLKNVTLVQYQHQAGTRTPSPAGIGPPAEVSGKLRQSVFAWPGARGVISTAYSGPTIFYAPIQEYGGQMWHRNFEYMKFYYDGWQFRKHVVIPKRPYMGKALAAIIGSGRLQHNAMDVFEMAVWGR